MRSKLRLLRWWSRVPSFALTAAALLRLTASAVPLVLVPRWALLAAVPVAVWAPLRWWLTAESALHSRYRRVERSEPIVDAASRVAAQFGLRREPVVLYAPDLRSLAAAVDTGRPGSTVIVTEEMVGWARSDHTRLAEAVLAHELAHLRRRHSQLRLVVSAVAAAAVLAVWAVCAFDVLLGAFESPARWDAGPYQAGSPAGVQVLLVPLVFSFVHGLLAVWSDRTAEWDADTDATRAGYGAELSLILAAHEPRRWFEPAGWRSHPAPQRRASRLRRTASNRARLGSLPPR